MQFYSHFTGSHVLVNYAVLQTFYRTVVLVICCGDFVSGKRLFFFFFVFAALNISEQLVDDCFGVYWLFTIYAKNPEILDRM